MDGFNGFGCGSILGEGGNGHANSATGMQHCSNGCSPHFPRRQQLFLVTRLTPGDPLERILWPRRFGFLHGCGLPEKRTPPPPTLPHAVGRRLMRFLSRRATSVTGCSVAPQTGQGCPSINFSRKYSACSLPAASERSRPRLASSRRAVAKGKATSTALITALAWRMISSCLVASSAAVRMPESALLVSSAAFWASSSAA